MDSNQVQKTGRALFGLGCIVWLVGCGILVAIPIIILAIGLIASLLGGGPDL